MQQTVKVDFTRPVLGLDDIRGTTDLPWVPGQSPDLSFYYPDQPDVARLRFWRTDSATNTTYRVDKGDENGRGGLVLTLESDPENLQASFALLVINPFVTAENVLLASLDNLSVTVTFDVLEVQKLIELERAASLNRSDELASLLFLIARRPAAIADEAPGAASDRRAFLRRSALATAAVSLLPITACVTTDYRKMLTRRFTGSVGAVATDASFGVPGRIPAGDAERKVSATCAVSYDPISTAPEGTAPKDVERMRLNAPNPLYTAGTRAKFNFEAFDFLRDELTFPILLRSTGPLPRNNSTEPLKLNLLAKNAEAAPGTVEVMVDLTQSGWSGAGSQAGHRFVSSQLKEGLQEIRMAGVSVNITDSEVDASGRLPPQNAGPIRVRITGLEVQFHTPD